MKITSKERRAQRLLAIKEAKEKDNQFVYQWIFICEDEKTFRAIAQTEAGAFRVLNAERPGMEAYNIGHKKVRIDL